MKNIALIIALSFVICQTALATKLHCLEKVSSEIVQQKSVELAPGKKTLLFSENGHISYITETKPHFFSLELFMAETEQRLYAESSLTSGSSLNLAVWTREALIEVQCSQNSVQTQN